MEDFQPKTDVSLVGSKYTGWVKIHGNGSADLLRKFPRHKQTTIMHFYQTLRIRIKIADMNRRSLLGKNGPDVSLLSSNRPNYSWTIRCFSQSIIISITIDATIVFEILQIVSRPLARREHLQKKVTFPLYLDLNDTSQTSHRWTNGWPLATTRDDQ